MSITVGKVSPSAVSFNQTNVELKSFTLEFVILYKFF